MLNIFQQPKFYRGNENIPSPKTKEYVSKEEFQRRVSEIIKCKKSIRYFAENYFYIINPDKGKHIVKLYPKQAELLKVFQNESRVIVLASRQVGKCQVAESQLLIRDDQTGIVRNIQIGKLFSIKHQTCPVVSINILQKVKMILKLFWRVICLPNNKNI